MKVSKKINDGKYVSQSADATNTNVAQLLATRPNVTQVRVTLDDGTVKRYKRAE